MDELLLALDFGGTKHAAALAVRGTPGWRAYRRRLAPAGADAVRDIEAVCALAQEILQGARPAAVGVSFGGPVDATTGTVRLSHHVPGWENIPLKARLEAEFGVPVTVDNDANIAALGEHRYGAGRGYAHLMYITVSTGVGGGWILNGRPWRGAEGMAGEIGHTTIDPQGPLCLCGKRGCVERYVSGPYITQEARERLAADPDCGFQLRELARGNLINVTGALLSEAAERGDALAQEILDRGANALGVGIGNVANVINPQRFILGGGVTHAGVRFLETIRAAARRTALPEVHFEIVPAALGDDAPLWGAIALAEEKTD